MAGVECLVDWQDTYGYATHLFLPKNKGLLVPTCCTPLLQSVENYEQFLEVYDGPGAAIFLISQSDD